MNIEYWDVALKVGAYFVGIVTMLVGMRYSIQGLKKDHEATAEKLKSNHTQTTETIGKIEAKVDDIGITLVNIQTRAARHDQRAQDIQNTLKDVSDRVTYLERAH